ncbi:hypothetical protein QYF36_013361 [Acer negundo]|nr:hypothetical protein QYF36_013361 [Acer negundo]
MGWDIPASFHAFHLDVDSEIEKVVVSIDLDSLVWTCSLDDVVSCKLAYDSLSKIPTDNVLRARGYISLSCCRFCYVVEEDLKYLFLDCPFVRGLWDVVSFTFGYKLKFDDTCLDLWLLGLCSIARV